MNKKTRIVLNGHFRFFGISVPVHWTIDIPTNGGPMPAHIPQVHFDGEVSATEITEGQPALPH